ncbi:LacI family DNA-binding transcriptional regulator [Streptomyces odontomachi]|uniref:LacI family DNA-binding transcriptional regulator n=1 Tax=Streptomyces odontomachi TaxID=2944940 RepID=UPI00210A9793|nr:LacI family DNA-binding transcriptional regulator [Streptomyces sp. ODS25]
MLRTPRPTMRDVAERLGVSVSAVSIALSERKGVSDELRERVRRTARAMGYVPDQAAVSLRTRRSRVMGLLIRNLQNPFFLDVVEGFDRECSAAGYQAMTSSARYEPRHERELLDAFAARGVDALAVAPIGPGRAVRSWARRTGKPVVVLNGSRAVVDSMHSLRIDGPQAVRLAVRHLAGLGHRRIALLTAPAATSPDPERLAAFTELMTERRLEPLVIESALTAHAAEAVLRAELRRPRAYRPTAIVTNSDWIAYAVYAAARAEGLRVPVDLSVVGHDDLPTSALTDPPLTTLRADRLGLGRRAARILIDSLDGPDGTPVRELLPVELVERASTAPPG